MLDNQRNTDDSEENIYNGTAEDAFWFSTWHKANNEVKSSSFFLESLQEKFYNNSHVTKINLLNIGKYLFRMFDNLSF